MILLRDSLCPQFPYRGNDMILSYYPLIVTRLANWQRIGFEFHLRSLSCIRVRGTTIEYKVSQAKCSTQLLY